MLATVSPYHLTSREPPAMAALLLAEACVTYLPAPHRGLDSRALRESFQRSSYYRALFDAWAWCEPLWRAGVVSSLHAGEDTSDDIRAEANLIAEDERLAGLMKPGLFDDPDRFLDTVAADLLRAGPDPAVSIPVQAGLDRFTARHALVAMRPAPASVAQRAEARVAKRLFAVALPILTQADGESILRARGLLAGPLAGLRAALADMARDASDDALDHRAVADRGRDPINHAARRYADEFDRHVAELTRCIDPDHIRVRHATATLTGTLLTSDAVVRSSRAALGALAGPRAEPPRDPTAHDRFLAIFVKPL